MKKLAVIAMLTLMPSLAIAEDKPAPKTDMVCGPNAGIEKVLIEKGYHHLLDMTAENGVVESFWAGGQQMVVTAQKDEKTSCLLTQFKEVTFNPKTIEKIYQVFKSTQKEL